MGIMYKICQTEQSTRRQRELEKGLLQLMLRRKYEDISVSDLCEQMQIPRKSFYRYFSSTDGALYSLIDHTMGDFFQMPKPEKKSRGNAVGDLDLFFAFWYDHKDFLDALQRSGLSGMLVERVSAFALHEGHLPKKVKDAPQPMQEIALSFVVCGLMAMMLNWHRQGFPVPANAMAQMAVTLLTTPLLNS